MTAPWYYQQRQYPADATQAPGAAQAFGRAGYPAQIQPGAPGISIIIVSLPPWLPQQIDPYALPPAGAPRPRQAWPAWDARRAMTALLALLLIAGALYLGGSLFSPGPAEPPAAGQPPAQDEGGPLSWLRLPWGADAPPAQAAQPQAEPFRWPWESAAAAAQGVVEDAQAAITLGLSLVLGVIVLLIILALVARRR